jgi:hypothetical protein
MQDMRTEFYRNVLSGNLFYTEKQRKSGTGLDLREVRWDVDGGVARVAAYWKAVGS